MFAVLTWDCWGREVSRLANEELKLILSDAERLCAAKLTKRKGEGATHGPQHHHRQERLRTCRFEHQHACCDLNFKSVSTAPM